MNVTDLPCPTCNAGVGAWCHDGAGRTRPGPTLAHPERTRRARAATERKEIP